MPKAMLETSNYPPLYPTLLKLQLADSMIRIPEGIVRDLPLRILGRNIQQNLLVLDMKGMNGKIPLILGRHHFLY